MAELHLAQINIARLLHPQGEPEVAEFFDNLDRVNAIAERMPGFVWRLKDDSNNATGIEYSDDPRVIQNISVWKSLEALQAFVFRTAHTAFYRKRRSWFEPMEKPHFAMWWVPAGARPTIAEASEKLARLEREGPSEDVFGWADTPAAAQWRSERCG